MEAWIRSNERKLIEDTRQAPGTRPIVRVAARGMGQRGARNGEAPAELHLETTDETGEPADWFDDYWWMDTLERWQHNALAVHILPTPRALLHPVVIHQVEMLYRVAPKWRRVGHCYVDDVTSEEDIRLLAISSYDEIRVVDAFRPGTSRGEAELRDVKIERLIAQVMRAQSSLGATRPLLIRVPPPQEPTTPAPTKSRPTTVAATASTA